MKTRRIKVKANAMEDADVNYISLVTRPASRIPFRVLKSEDPEEGSLMFNLQTLFKQDGEASKVTGCILAAVVVQQKHEAHFAPQLKELGVKIDDRIEKDGVVILRQCDYKEEDITVIQLNEMGGLFLNASEAVQKQFDPFPEGTDFSENFSQGAFLPGVSIATEVMMETMRNVLRTADDQKMAKKGITMLLDAYTSHILDFVDELPEVAFRIDVLGLNDFDDSAGDSQNTADADAGEGEGDEDHGDSESEDDAEDGNDQSSDTGDSDNDTGGADAAGDGDSAGDTGDAGAGDQSEASGEGSAKEKETASVEKKDDLTSDDDEEVDIDDDGNIQSKEKREKSESKLADVLKAFKTEILEAVSGVRTDVADLQKKQDKLTEKVEATAEIAEKAQLAVKGTVPSNSDDGDEDYDQSLGTHRSKGEGADEKLWGGTSLDRIAGDLESAA